MIEGQLGTAAAQAILGDSPSIEDKKFNDAQLEDSVVTQDKGVRSSMSMIQILRDPLISRIALTVITLHIIQQLIGMNAVMYYSNTIFNMAFDAKMSMYLAIVTAAANFAATILSLILIDRMGRRPLLMIAEAGTCIFSVLLIIGYVYNLGALLIVAVFGSVMSFAIGVGLIPWMMTSESTPVYTEQSIKTFKKKEKNVGLITIKFFLQ